MADEKNIKGIESISGTGAAKGVGQVSGLNSVDQVKNIQTVDKVKSVQATTSIGSVKAAGKIAGGRSISGYNDEQKKALMLMIEEEAEKLFGKGGDKEASAMKKMVTDAVKMAISAAGEE